MAKKSRKARSKIQGQVSVQNRPSSVVSGIQQSNNQGRMMQATATTFSSTVNLQKHEYLASDLRSLVIIAGALFVIIIILALVIG